MCIHMYICIYKESEKQIFHHMTCAYQYITTLLKNSVIP